MTKIRTRGGVWQRSISEVSDAEASVIIQPLSRRAKVQLDETATVDAVVRAIDQLHGETSAGLPPTEAAARAAVARITKGASALLDELDGLTTHLRAHAQSEMVRQGCSLSGLKRELEAAEGISAPVSASSNPYVERFLRSVFSVWVTSTGDDARSQSNPTIEGIESYFDEDAPRLERLKTADLPAFAYWVAAVTSVFDKTRGWDLSASLPADRIKQVLRRIST